MLFIAKDLNIVIIGTSHQPTIIVITVIIIVIRRHKQRLKRKKITNFRGERDFAGYMLGESVVVFSISWQGGLLLHHVMGVVVV